MIESRAFETSFGPVPVWAAFERFSADRDLVLVIRGVLAHPDQLFGLAKTFPDADFAFVLLPGMRAPFFANDKVEDFASAFDQVLDKLERSRVVVVGVSLGGVVAMAMKSPRLRSLLLLDAPLSTAPMWMLPDALRPLVRDHERGARWVWAILGISQTQVVNRDYRPVLAALTTPTALLLASDPLGEPRAAERDPSAVCEADRALYDAHPLVRAQVVEDTGHQVAKDRPAALAQTLRRLLSASPTPAAG